MSSTATATVSQNGQASPSEASSSASAAAIFRKLHPESYLQRYLLKDYRPDGRKVGEWRDVSVNAGMCISSLLPLHIKPMSSCMRIVGRAASSRVRRSLIRAIEPPSKDAILTNRLNIDSTRLRARPDGQYDHGMRYKSRSGGARFGATNAWLYRCVPLVLSM